MNQYFYDESEFRPIYNDYGRTSGYFVRNDGKIFSSKTRGGRYYPRSEHWDPLIPSTSGNSPYPKVSLRMNGRARTCMVHTLVADAWLELPKPDNILKEEWDNTSVEMKRLLRKAFVVNHIDHDKDNYHPSNLEFCTQQQNIKKSVRYYF